MIIVKKRNQHEASALQNRNVHRIFYFNTAFRHAFLHENHLHVSHAALFLPFRYEFFTKERMVRKAISALGGTLIFTALMLFVPTLLTGDLWNPLGGDAFVQVLGPLLLVFIITLFGFFIYGLPVSLISDWLAGRYARRLAVAGIVHIGFGLLLIGELSFIPVICAVIFWVFGEILQRRTGKNLIETDA